MKLNKGLFLLTAIILFSNVSHSQWVSVFKGHQSVLDGSSSGDIGTSIAADNSGNCYVTGYTSSYSSSLDYLTIKYNSNGDTLWTAVYNGESNGEDKAFGIAVDQEDNVLVTGYSYSDQSGFDFLTIKYNSSGEQQWVSRYNGTGNEEDKAFGIAVDGSGNVFVTGKSKNSNANFDCVTIKYNSEGSIQWTDRYDGSNGDDGNFAIAVDKNGNVYSTGYSDGSTTGYDYVTIKFDNSSGSRNWVSRYSGQGNKDDKAFGIAVDDDCNVYVTGYTSPNSNSDYLTVKYDSSGAEQWTAGYNGTGNGTDKAFGIAVDDEDNVYITGESAGDNSDLDYVTIKYNSSGTEQWTARYDGTGNSTDIASALVLTNSYVVVTGTSRSSASPGSEDMVTIKYDKATGSQSDLSRYNGGENYSDVALSIAADTSYDIFVTGYSMKEGDNSNSGTSLITLKYKGEKNLIINTASNNAPLSYSLRQNYPNPFNPSTTISFDIMNSGIVRMVIYDILGREVKVLINQNLQAGKYNVSFNLSGLASGVYFYELRAGTFRDVKKLTLVK